MKQYKYFRIHSQNIAYHTQQPRGLFAVVGKLINENKLSAPEEKKYKKQKAWFEEILPVPDFYEDGNSIKAITWYKNNEKAKDIFSKMTFFMEIADKYNIELYISRINFIPGELVYEDDFQIGIVNCNHDHEEIDRILFEF